MEKITGISAKAFEPCHIAGEESPFLMHERKSAAHTDRFFSKIAAENDICGNYVLDEKTEK